MHINMKRTTHQNLYESQANTPQSEFEATQFHQKDVIMSDESERVNQSQGTPV